MTFGTHWSPFGDRAACGAAIAVGQPTTPFMSGVTCAGCAAAVQVAIEEVRKTLPEALAAAGVKLALGTGVRTASA